MDKEEQEEIKEKMDNVKNENEVKYLCFHFIKKKIS